MPSIIIWWCTVELIFWGRSWSSLLLLLLLLHKDIRTNYYYQSIDYYYYYDTPTYAVIHYYTTGTTEKTRLLTGTRPFFGLPIQRDPLFRVVYYRYTVSYRINKNVHLNGRRSAAESSSVRHVQNTVLRVARSPRSGRRGPRVSPQRVQLSVRRCYNISYMYNRYIIIIIISITPSNLLATTRPRRRPWSHAPL